MDDFCPLEIPLYEDDPFLTQDTIFEYLQHQANSSNYPLISSSSTLAPPFVETDHQVITAPATATAAATNKTTVPIETTAAAATTNKNKGKRVRKPPKPKDNGSGNIPSDQKEKKVFHRDLERERRSEMAKFSTSLRKLLPAESIKAKSSLPDHVHQAENHIKHKEDTIRELKMKRDKLKNELAADMNVPNGQVARSFSSIITFTVESCSDGSIEILMTSNLADDWFPLSKVLNVLLKEGLAVITCTYTKMNQKLHCTIRTDMGGRKMSDADLGLLREKLGTKVAEWKGL